MTTPHPFNTGFEWQRVGDPTSPRYLAGDLIEQFNRDGYCLVDNAFPPETIDKLIGAIDPWEERATEFLRTQPGEELFIAQADAITFTVHLVSHEPTCQRFTRHESLRGIVSDLVGDDVSLYWDQAVYKKPEQLREFPWHQDNGYAFVEPQQYLTCWVPLTDATIDNGCPWVAPGLHLGGTLEHRASRFGLSCFDAFDGAVPVEAPAGSAVVFSSLTPHRTGPNLTDEVRKAYIVQFAPTGAVVIHGRGRREHTPANDPTRQYEVLRDGRRVD